jgi:hypothetical protein
MKYQLVIQFDAARIADSERFVALEEWLIATLSRKIRVDGHDFGKGQLNIFLFTDDPTCSLAEIRRALGRDRQFGRYRLHTVKSPQKITLSYGLLL